MTDLGAISAACTVTIGAAKVCHCADIYTGTERGVVGAGFNLITVADDFAGDCRIALIRLRRKTPCFSYGDIRRSET